MPLCSDYVAIQMLDSDEVGADVVGAAFVALFAAMVLLAYHKLPNVSEALHFYKENDQYVFVAMRTCHFVISISMALNAKFLIGWILKLVWVRMMT